MDDFNYLKPSLQKRQKRRDKRLDEELIECYRRGWRTKQVKGYNNSVKRNLYAHAKQRESMKFRHGGGTRSFNDNLEPFQRFLASHVGKNWNKVYSELCQHLNKNTVSGLHVFNHLYDFVYEKIEIEGKKVYELKSGKYKELRSTERFPKFYINPKTGQLMKAKLITNRELKKLWQR